jgi:hypothetical protein
VEVNFSVARLGSHCPTESVYAFRDVHRGSGKEEGEERLLFDLAYDFVVYLEVEK